ncbi:Cdkn3 [Symbiodinium sp. CCMP2456]|nr:Cdkn3 [Symbiodinium sp. CCMP2456]
MNRCGCMPRAARVCAVAWALTALGLLPGYMGLWPRCPDVPDQQRTSHSCRRASRRMRGHSAALDMYIVEIPELSAKVAITPCPGKRERDLGADLDAVKSWGAEAVVTLVQDDELRMLGVEDMKTAVESRKMKWFHCPVPDFSAPGMFFEGCWVQRGDGEKVRKILRKGGKVVAHCRGGIGRAGTIASRLLIELGVASPEEALRRVRRARPGAVETWDQENHVLQLTAVKE